MYHCNLKIYYNLKNAEIMDDIRAIMPKERFSHEFVEFNDLTVSKISEADIIIYDNEDVSVFMEINSKRNENAHILVLVDSENKDKVLSLLTDEDDYFVKPVSKDDFIFKYRKILSVVKKEKDSWLNKYYLETAINSVPDLVWFKDKLGAHLKVNDSFCKVVNKSHEQIEGRGHYYIWDIEPEEYAKGEFICMESEYEVMEKKKTCVFDEKVLISNDFRELRTYKSPLFDYDGSVMGTVGIAKDVTVENRYKNKMIENANHDFLTELYNRRYIYNYIEHIKGTAFTIYFLDLNSFKKVNDMFGHAEGDRALILTKNVLEKTMPDAVIARVGGDEFMLVKLGNATKKQIDESTELLENKLKEAFGAITNFSFLSASIGSYYVGENSNIPIDNIIDEADERMYRKKKRYHEGISRELANKDPISGLDRYEIFLEKLKKELEYISDKTIVIIYGDIKHFKYINDTYGYKKGNETLKFFANHVSDLGENLICATRLYSDNIIAAAYLNEKYTPDEFCQILTKWGNDLESEFSRKYSTNKLKFVAGVNFINKDQVTDVETAISNANLAKKEAKKNKEGCVLTFTKRMLDEIKWEIEISTSLADAIANRNLVAFYQPKIDAKSLKIMGGEALVRWKQKDGKFMPPDQFIPILEKTGQIIEVDYYIYREVFSFIHNRIRDGKKIVPISMNVSRLHLRSDSIIRYVKSLLDEFPIPSSYIEFELTESIYIKNSEEAIKLVNSFHELGIRVSMDDFGTGYSSLNMLGSLPIDTIKLDKAFLQHKDFNDNDKIIISSVINMSKKLNMQSICEGVETQSKIDYLKDAGCDQMQGYYFSKPVSQDIFEQMVEK